MRTVPFLSSLLLTVSLPALSVATANRVLSPMTDWHIAPMATHKEAGPSYCAIASHYTNETPIVTMTRNASGKSSMAIEFQNAALEKGRKYALTLTIGTLSHTFSAKAISTSQLVLQLGDRMALYEAWSHGENMTISLDGTPGVYHLAGNERAANEFNHCLQALTPMPLTQTQALASAVKPIEPHTIPELVEPVMAPPAQTAAIPPVPQKQQNIPSFASATPAEAIFADTTVKSANIDVPIKTVSIIWDSPVPAYTPTEPLPVISSEALFGNIEVEKPEAPVQAAETPATTSQDKLKSSLAAAREKARGTVPPLVFETPVQKSAPVEKQIEKQAQASAPKSPRTLAKTETAAGTENTVSTQTDLKSSLATARQEAKGTVPALVYDRVPQPAHHAAPQPATTPTPEDEMADAVDTVIPAALPEPIAPKKPASVAKTETTTQVSTVTEIAQTDVAPAPVQNTSDIQSLIFDSPDMAKTYTTDLGATSKPAATKPVTPVSETRSTPIFQAQPAIQRIEPPKADIPSAPIPTPAPQQKPAQQPTYESKEQPPAFAPPVAPAPVMPAPKPVLSVSNDTQPAAKAASRDLNTVTPSVGQPAAKAIPAAPVSAASLPQFSAPVATHVPAIRRVIKFKPAPAAPISRWEPRTIHGKTKNDNFCLIENKFDNDLFLMLGQRIDGYSTLGLNYGIDMLQGNRPYQVNVQVDGMFDENFLAYAESPRMLVVQLGKKASFFDALNDAEALHVSMPGVASTFALNDLSHALNELSSCLVDIGGEALKPAPVAALPAGAEAAIAVPVAPVVTDEAVASASPAMPAPVAARPATVPALVTETPAPRWTDKIEAVLRKAGFRTQNAQKDATSLRLTDSSLTTTATIMPQGDILEAASQVIDTAEKTCKGVFSSQMGIPEQHGVLTTQQMESKCVTGDAVTVSTWLIESQNGTSTAWEMQAPRDQRGQAFDARRKIVKAVQNESHNASLPLTEKNS